MPDKIASLVKRTLAELETAGTPARAEGAAAYFKSYEKLKFFGVDTTTVRRIASRLKKGDARDWNLKDAVAFADAMISRPELEAKGVGICLLGRFRAGFNGSILREAKKWLACHCTDWASADMLCGEVIGPLLVSRPDLVGALRPWRTSRHLYVRRASAVALIPPVRRGIAMDEAYPAALALGGEAHHLLQKAAGWLLREAGKIDMERLERFLREHGPSFGRTTISYAVERFEPDRRKALLVATKPRYS